MASGERCVKRKRNEEMAGGLSERRKRHHKKNKSKKIQIDDLKLLDEMSFPTLLKRKRVMRANVELLLDSINSKPIKKFLKYALINGDVMQNMPETKVDISNYLQLHEKDVASRLGISPSTLTRKFHRVRPGQTWPAKEISSISTKLYSLYIEQDKLARDPQTREPRKMSREDKRAFRNINKKIKHLRDRIDYLAQPVVISI